MNNNNNNRFKFRVWDKDKKIFLSDYDFCIYDGAAIRIEVGGTEINSFGSSYNPLKLEEDNLGGIYLDKNLLIQQFTGLQDSKGRNVFEGDILKITISSDYMNQGSYFCFVKFDFGRFCLSEKSNFGKQYIGDKLSFYPSIKDGEIVGNIFEHAELLK